MNDNLSKALSIFIEAMRPFVVGFLLEKFKNEPWEGVFFARLKPDKQNTWNKAVQSLSADSDRKQLVSPEMKKLCAMFDMQHRNFLCCRR